MGKFRYGLVLVLMGAVSAKMWYVDDDGGGADFTEVHDAVNAVGDTIIV